MHGSILHMNDLNVLSNYIKSNQTNCILFIRMSILQKIQFHWHYVFLATFMDLVIFIYLWHCHTLKEMIFTHIAIKLYAAYKSINFDQHKIIFEQYELRQSLWFNYSLLEKKQIDLFLFHLLIIATFKTLTIANSVKGNLRSVETTLTIVWKWIIGWFE